MDTNMDEAGGRAAGGVRHVTLLYFDDCSNWTTTAAHLVTLADDDPGLLASHHRVTTPEEADRVGFRGSTSTLVDEVDPFADPDAPVGLSCRVYHTPDGMAGSPTLEQLRWALAAG